MRFEWYPSTSLVSLVVLDPAWTSRVYGVLVLLLLLESPAHEWLSWYLACSGMRLEGQTLGRLRLLG